VVIGFYLAALPYDYYNYKKDGIWGLRQRMEFFKKGYPITEGLDWYLQERTLNQDATSLLAFELSRNSSPIEFIRDNPRKYLQYVKDDFKVMWHREFTGHRIPSPIFTLSLILLVLVLLIRPGKIAGSAEGHVYLLFWFAPLLFIVPLGVSVVDRYFLPIMIPLVFWCACGLDLARKNVAGLFSFHLLDRRLLLSELGLWLLLLLFLQPTGKVRKLVMDKSTYPKKESRWINEATKGARRKIIMSPMPYPALYSGNYWYMMPMDNINRVSHYAQAQKADFMLADNHFYEWLQAPQDYLDQYLSSFSKPGLDWLGQNRVHFKYQGKIMGKDDALYKVVPARPAAVDPVNIILISIDTLRADHLSCYGYPRPTTPNIDRIAAQGLRFEKAISQSPKTTPSHMTMFTSLYPEVHGSRRDYQGKSFVKLPASWKTLPEILKAHGWRTAAFTGGVQVAKGFGFERGFDVFEENLLRLKPQGLEPALAWLSQIKPDEKFFLFIHTYQVHDPYCPPPPYNKLYDPGYDGWIEDDWEKLSNASQPGKLFPAHNIFWGGAEKGVKGDQLNLDIITERDTRHMVALYDGNIAYTDEVLGGFFNELEKKGVLGSGRTLLIITSDHGEEFREHGDFLHKKLYRETMQVPLIFYWPGKLGPGKVVKGQVRLLDLAPTILDLIGLPVNLQMQGVSLKSVMNSNDRAVLSAYSEDPFLRRDFSLRTESAMYYQMENEGKKELYFEMLDPGEQTNLYTEKDDFERALGYILAKPADIQDTFIRSMDNFHNYNNRYKIIFKAPEGKLELSAVAKEQLDELRALGYIK
jgi:arylsulfatase A-like enzyme